jgi:hypothetical protein
MTSTIRTIAAMTLLIGTGLVHGTWTNRWRPSAALTAQAARLDSVPTVIGDWKSTGFELDPEEREMAGAVNYLARRYTHAGRGITLTVLLLCGLPGNISTHSPEICYPGEGFSLDEATGFTRDYGSPNGPAEFRTALAKRGGTNPSVLRLFWGWNASKGWFAPDNPRWTFASEPALCKLYVVRETAGAIVDAKDDPCNEFLTVFLPELDRIVFSPSTQTRNHKG